MTPHECDEFDRLFLEWRSGDQRACSRLIELAYLDLRRIAKTVFRGEYSDNTLQPTVLAHEACVKMLRCDPLRLVDRNHFFATAAIQMRNSVIDHLRSLPIDKRNGLRVPHEPVDLPHITSAIEMLDLELALNALARVSPRACRVVELRFIVGLEESEAAELLGISVTTLKRDWNFAKGMLADYLGGATRKLEVKTTRRLRKIA